jgi:hypothetical protein
VCLGLRRRRPEPDGGIGCLYAPQAAAACELHVPRITIHTALLSPRARISDCHTTALAHLGASIVSDIVGVQASLLLLTDNLLVLVAARAS